MTIKNVHFIGGKNRADVVLSSAGANSVPKSHLSPISTELLANSLLNKVSIVFAQGPLNLTPLICALLHEQNREGKRDVLIGIPRNQFSVRNKEYVKNFYSLHRGIGTFFYDKLLYCTADVKNSTTTTLNLDTIKLRPKRGMKRFKDTYECVLVQSLEKGDCAGWPKIISVPIDYTLPENILQTREFFLDNVEYTLDPFSPGFVILESVNERIFSLEAVKSIVQELLDNKIGGIIHFSWPYLPGLKAFLEEIDHDDSIAVFHMGKRYGIEMRDTFTNHLISLDRLGSPTDHLDIREYIRDHPSFRELSLEGKNWNGYYPSPIKLSELDNIKGLIPRINALPAFDPINMYNHMDRMISNIREELYGAEIPPKYRSLMAFPPFIDSFLRPKDIKILSINESGEYRRYPIAYALELSLDKGTPGLDIFSDLCSQCDRAMEFSHLLMSIQTPVFIGKITALFYYIYQHLYTFDLKEGGNLHLIICDYTSQLGSRRKMLEKLANMLGYIQDNLDKHQEPYISGDFFDELLLQNQTCVKIEKGNECKISDIQFTLSRPRQEIHISLTLLVGTDDRTKRVEKEINISFIDFSSLNTRLPNDIENAYLLLPGPIPIFSFRKDSPIITKGFDLLLRPFKRIIFFSYPGMNTKRLLDQIGLIDVLMGPDSKCEIALKDLALSTSRMPKKLVVGIAGTPTIKIETEIPDDIMPDDNPFDSNVRSSIIEQIKSEDDIEIQHLSSIWETLTKRREPHSSLGGDFGSYEFEQTALTVRFKGSVQQNIIHLNSRNYVRVLSGGGDTYVLASELEPDQEIVYLQSDDKDSIDNYFIKSFSEYADWSLEDILDTYFCLSQFIDVIQNIHSVSEFDEEDFEPLYWLDSTEKEFLFLSVKFLLMNTRFRMEDEDFFDLWQKVFDNEGNIWSALHILPDDKKKELKYDFESGRNYPTYSNISKIAKLFGLRVTGSTFIALLSSVHSNRSVSASGRKAVHYFFREPESLFAIGRLLGNQDIIENYEEINDAGVNIWKVLELVGHSISRVIEGKGNPYNEMDQIIRDRMLICRIISVGDG